jgi:hypothetical protein
MSKGKRLSAVPNSTPPSMLRCRPVALQRFLVWILVAFILAGAAAYVQGTRYALAGHLPQAVLQSADATTPPEVAPSAPNGQTRGNTPSLSSLKIPAHSQSGPLQDKKPPDGNCSERHQAPRSEPAPLRTAPSPGQLRPAPAGSPPSSRHIVSEPDLPALTVVQLAVSRT